MEQARYWTWAKRKRDFNPLVQSSHNSSSSYDDSSWEEQAFAEDASGHLGGCIWPPRSYSCSFCRREFRSAQALGGHMNVHRRDRARLKLSSPTVLPHNEILINPHHNNDRTQNLAYNSLEFHFPPQNCNTLASNPNPSCDPSNVTSPSLKTSIHQERYCEKTLLFPNFSSSSTLEEQQYNKRSSPRSSSLEESNMASEQRKEGERSTSRILELGCRSKKVDYVKNSDNISASLSLVVRRTWPTLSDGEEEEEEEESTVGCKKRRMEISPCSIEELDLELRLGTERHKATFDEPYEFAGCM